MIIYEGIMCKSNHPFLLERLGLSLKNIEICDPHIKTNQLWAATYFSFHNLVSGILRPNHYIAFVLTKVGMLLKI